MISSFMFGTHCGISPMHVQGTDGAAPNNKEEGH